MHSWFFCWLKIRADMHPIIAHVQSFLLDGDAKEQLGAKLQLKDTLHEDFEFSQRWNLALQSDKVLRQLTALGQEIGELDSWVHGLDLVQTLMASVTDF